MLFIISNECLVYIYSLDFTLNIYVTKKRTMTYLINLILISNRADFPVHGPSSFISSNKFQHDFHFNKLFNVVFNYVLFKEFSNFKK